MSAIRKRWPYETAMEIAQQLYARLVPGCIDIIIAGSLRRHRSDVGDIELLYITRREIFSSPPSLPSLFPDLPVDPQPISQADSLIHEMLMDGTLTKRISKSGNTMWGSQNKYALHHSGIPVDLFSTTLETKNNSIVFRTGPAVSNARIATAALQMGFRWNPYGPGFTRLSDNTIFPMHSEEDVFSFVNLPYLPPEQRS